MEEFQACPQQQGELTQCCTLSSGVLRCPASVCPSGYFVSFTNLCHTSSEETTRKQEEETSAFYSAIVTATTSENGASVSVTAESLRGSSQITTSGTMQNTSSTNGMTSQTPYTNQSTLTTLTSSENSSMTAAGFTMIGEETTPNGTVYVTCCLSYINSSDNQQENERTSLLPVIPAVVTGCLSLLAVFTFLLIWKRKKSKKRAYDMDKRLSQRPVYEEDINRYSFLRPVKKNMARPIALIAKDDYSKTETIEVYEEIALSPQTSYTSTQLTQASNDENLTNPCHHLQFNKIIIGDDIDDHTIRPYEERRKEVEFHRRLSTSYCAIESVPVNGDNDEYSENDAVQHSWAAKRNKSRKWAQRGVNSDLQQTELPTFFPETLICEVSLCNSLDVENTSIDSSTEDLPLNLSACSTKCAHEGQTGKYKMRRGKGPLSSYKSVSRPSLNHKLSSGNRTFPRLRWVHKFRQKRVYFRATAALFNSITSVVVRKRRERWAAETQPRSEYVDHVVCYPVRRSRWLDSIKTFKDSVESVDSGFCSTRESSLANDDADFCRLKDHSRALADTPEAWGSRESPTNADDSYYAEEQGFLRPSKSTQTVLRNVLPDPVLSEHWQFSNTFSLMGGKLQADDSDIILEVPTGGIAKDEVVTIYGAVSTDLNKAYSELHLPNDEVIVSPIVEYFAGLEFRFQKAVRIVLPSFMPPNVPAEHIHVYQFRSGNNKVHCYRLQTLNTSTEHFEVDTSGRQIHIVTHHFSGYLCTVCERACADYTKPHDITLQVFAKHVLRADDSREVIVRLDMWDGRFRIKDFHKPREESTKNRQMHLITDETLPRLPAGIEEEGVQVGVRLGVKEIQKDLWTHVTDGATVLKPVLQTMELNRLYPSRCYAMEFPCCFSWELENQTDIPPQMEFECVVYVGYISHKERATTADDTNIFMTDPPRVTITVRRAKEFDADYRSSFTIPILDSNRASKNLEVMDSCSGRTLQTHSRQSSISSDSVLSPSECRRSQHTGRDPIQTPIRIESAETVNFVFQDSGAVSPKKEQPSRSPHPKEQHEPCRQLQPHEELSSHVSPSISNSTRAHDNMREPVQASSCETSCEADLNQSQDR